VFKDRGPFVKDQAREALNFQITLLIGYLGCSVLNGIPFIGWIFGVASFALWITGVILSILAALSANKGEAYRYPYSLRLVPTS
jgi:uncharacterized Tic20 family protein